MHTSAASGRVVPLRDGDRRSSDFRKIIVELRCEFPAASTRQQAERLADCLLAAGRGVLVGACERLLVAERPHPLPEHGADRPRPSARERSRQAAQTEAAVRATAKAVRHSALRVD